MLQAIGKNLIVKPIYEVKKGNIIIPLSAQEFKQYHGFVCGLVISVGNKFGLKFAGERLRSGDKILFQRHEGFKIEYDGEVYLRISDRWVGAKLND